MIDTYRTTCIGEDLRFNNSTTEKLDVITRDMMKKTYFHPLPIVIHLHFKRWIGKGEIRINPAVLQINKEKFNGK